MRHLLIFLLALSPLMLSAQNKNSKLMEFPASKPQRLLLVVKPSPVADASGDMFNSYGTGMMTTRCTIVNVKNGEVKEKEIYITHKASERYVFAFGGNITVWVEKSYTTVGGKSNVLYTLAGGGYFE